MAYTCPVCGKVSHHPEDERQGYCGNCHAFTGVCATAAFHIGEGTSSCDEPVAEVFGNIGLCRGCGREVAQAISDHNERLNSDEEGSLDATRSSVPGAGDTLHTFPGQPT